jgi:hypothetical protein
VQRCARAETLHFRARWNFNPANFGKFAHDETVVQIGLYDARLTNQFLRLLRELEQRQEKRKSADCRMQRAECRTTAAHGTLQTGESAGEVEQEERVKNEPNLAISECRLPNAECVQRLENEPNLPEEALACANLAKVSTNLRKVGSDGAREMKNEPDSVDFRMPSADPSFVARRAASEGEEGCRLPKSEFDLGPTIL